VPRGGVEEGGGEGRRQRGVRRRGAWRGGGGRLGGRRGSIGGIRQGNRGVPDEDGPTDAIAARQVRDGPVHGPRRLLDELGN